MTRRRTRWIIGGFSTLLVLLFLLPLIGYWIMSRFVMTPEKLRDLLVTEVNWQVKGHFDCRSVELTYWDTWPLAGVAIHGVSFVGPDPDTPKLRVSLERLTVSLNAIDYWRNRRFNVQEIGIYRPRIYVLTGDGHPFDFRRAERALVRSRMDSLLRDVRLEVRRLTVEEGSVHVEEAHRSLTTHWAGIRLALSGDFSAEESSGTLSLSTDSSWIASPTLTLKQDFPVRMESAFATNLPKREVRVKAAHVTIGQVPFDLRGTYRLEAPHTIWMDTELSLSATRLEELLGYVPPPFATRLKSYRVGGKTALTLTARGVLDADRLPDIQVRGTLTDGLLARQGERYGLDRIGMDFFLDYPANQPDSSRLEIRDLRLSGLDCLVEGEAKIRSLPDNPFIDITLRSDVDFDRLGREFLDPDTIQLSGGLRSNLALVFQWDDLRRGRYDRIWADGTIDIDRLRLRSEAHGLSAYAENLHGAVGYKQNRSRFIHQREVLGLTLGMDTLGVRMDGLAQVAISRLRLSSNTGLQQNTSAITPLTTHLTFDRLQSRVRDHMALIASGAELHWGVKPSDADKRRVAMALVLSSDSLEYLNIREQQATIVANHRFIAELHPKATGLRWRTLADPERLLRDCDVKGYIDFDRLRSFSRRFPLQVRVRGTRLGFKNNRLILNNAEMTVGGSDALVNGEIVTYARAGKRRRLVEGDLSLRSRHIDFNELRKALLQGERAEETPAPSSARLLNIERLDQSIQRMEQEGMLADEEAARLIAIPENWSLALSFDAGSMKLYDFDMREVRGVVDLKDRKATCDFSTRTNMGDTKAALLYKALDPGKADIYVDWDLKRIQVGKLRRMFPAIQTLFPMLSSIDGELDCKLTSHCPIDSALNVDLDRLSATCSLDGRDMVLFTNETFHEIATKFRFKDRERNKIDRITADFIAKERAIEIFPFPLDVDRYRFLIGGRHSMDMSFQYHVDVLKSPIPFNFGVNLDGKPGDFHYRVGKTRYTELFKDPIRHEEFRMSKQRSLDETRAEILREMRAVR